MAGEPPLGSVLGGYRLDALLGQGGMGVVYRATDLRLGRVVALKVATAVTWAPDRIERFHREGGAASRIAHPNVVAVYAAGEEGPWRFLVMELVAGGSLAARLEREGKISWREAARLGAGIARGLAAIHAASFVHRDVKPGNVLVGKDGEPKIADFGLSRSLDSAAERLTLTSESVGTVAFMAPEQAEGGKATAESDLYGLGATLFALVSGEAPYPSGPAYSVLKKKLLEPAPRVRGAPPSFEQLVARLMAADPGARGKSAAAVARELDAVGKDAGRKRPPIRLAILTLALVGIALALVIDRSRPPRPAPETPLPPAAPVVSARPLDDPKADLAPLFASRGEFRLEAVLDLRQGGTPRGVASLAAVGSLGVAGMPGGAIVVFDTTTLANRAEWKGHLTKVAGVAVTADGTRVLTAATGGTACLWNVAAATQEQLWSSGGKRELHAAAISGDDKRAVVTSTDGGLYVLDLASGREIARDHVGHPIFGLAVLDETRVIATDGRGRVGVWDTTAPVATSATLDWREKAMGAHLPVAADGEANFFSADRVQLRYINGRGERRRDVDLSGPDPTAAALSSRGELGLLADDGGRIRGFDFTSASGVREWSMTLPGAHAPTALVWLSGAKSFLAGTKDGLILRFGVAARPR